MAEKGKQTPVELKALCRELNKKEAHIPAKERATMVAPPGLIRSPRNGALMPPGDMRGKRTITEQTQIDRVRRGSRRLTLKMLRTFEKYVREVTKEENVAAARDPTLQFIWKEVVPYAVQKLPIMSEQRLSMETEGGGQPVFAVIQVQPQPKPEIPEAEYEEVPSE
jgi:hypothetical protein